MFGVVKQWVCGDAYEKEIWAKMYILFGAFVASLFVMCLIVAVKV